MEIKYQASDRASFVIDVDNVKQAFQFMAYCDSIFGVDMCGNCKSPDLRLLYRTAQEYEFYSLQCKNCHHELKFGQTKVGEKLYAKGWEEPYQGGESTSDEAPEQKEKPAAKPAGKKKDDIAF